MMRSLLRVGLVIAAAIALMGPARAGTVDVSTLSLDQALSYEFSRGATGATGAAVYEAQFFPPRRRRRIVRRCVRFCRAASPVSPWRFGRCVRRCVRGFIFASQPGSQDLAALR